VLRRHLVVLQRQPRQEWSDWRYTVGRRERFAVTL